MRWIGVWACSIAGLLLLHIRKLAHHCVAVPAPAPGGCVTIRHLRDPPFRDSRQFVGGSSQFVGDSSQFVGGSSQSIPRTKREAAVTILILFFGS